MAYEDDQTAIYLNNFGKIRFPVSKIFFFCSHLHLQLPWWRRDKVTSTSFKFKFKIDLKGTLETDKPHLKKLVISPTHKRTEGRAPVLGSEFTSKDAALQGGSAELLLVHVS